MIVITMAKNPFSNTPEFFNNKDLYPVLKAGFRFFSLKYSTKNAPAKPPRNIPMIMPGPINKGVKATAPVIPPMRDAITPFFDGPNLLAPEAPSRKSRVSARRDMNTKIIIILKPIFSNPVTQE